MLKDFLHKLSARGNEEKPVSQGRPNGIQDRTTPKLECILLDLGRCRMASAMESCIPTALQGCAVGLKAVVHTAQACSRVGCMIAKKSCLIIIKSLGPAVLYAKCFNVNALWFVCCKISSSAHELTPEGMYEVRRTPRRFVVVTAGTGAKSTGQLSSVSS